MLLQTHIPGKPLTQFVNMFWYWEGYHPLHPKERILPHGMMELTINLSESALTFTYPESGRVAHIQGPIVAGARSSHFLVDTAEPASILSVWFKPGAALPFFGIPGDELHNQHIGLEHLWGCASSALYEQLLAAPDVMIRFHLLEKALLHRLTLAQTLHPAVDFALAQFRHTPYAPTIKAVTEKISLSPTRFIQVFKQATGLTPKRFCRVLRFQETLRLITVATHNTSPDWAELALACGYFDQAHFINDFKTFTGITPTQYTPQDAEHRNNLPVFDGG